jgi:hypothetical protein
MASLPVFRRSPLGEDLARIEGGIGRSRSFLDRW